MYARGIRPGSSPVGDWQAGVLNGSYLDRMPQTRFQECLLAGGTLGLHHGFEPVTITVEPGYWVSIDLLGVTVADHGNEKRFEQVWAGPGAVFLPVRYTQLLSGPLRNQRRNCIEIAEWLPASEPGKWMLLWRLYEVRGVELKDIAIEELVYRPSRPISRRVGHSRTSFDSRSTTRVSPDGLRSLVANERPQKRTRRVALTAMVRLRRSVPGTAVLRPSL